MEEPESRKLPRRYLIALAAIPLVAVVLAELAVVARDANPPPREASKSHPTPVPSAVIDAEARATAMRASAIRQLLVRRSRAVLHHDRAAWLAAVDPQRPAFRRRQARLFANLRHVPFASWSYSFDETSQWAPGILPSHKYDAPIFAPSEFALHYRLRGFDRKPTAMTQHPTFVRRGDQWYLSSLTDFRGRGETVVHDLWEYGPVRVVRAPRVLVLGHPGSEAVMQQVAAEVTADVPRVDAVWPRKWQRRAVVLVPRTQNELSHVVADFGNLDNIAAVATAEVAVTGTPNPVGNRIGINPANWPKLSSLGRRIVVTHELTHVATRPYTGASVPTWLAEGFADYVAYRDSGIATSFVAQELARDVNRPRTLRRLPGDSAFRSSSSRLSQAYEGAWLACRAIADRWGQAALIRLYVTIGRSSYEPTIALADAVQQVLHVSMRELVSTWRSYVHRQLG